MKNFTKFALGMIGSAVVLSNSAIAAPIIYTGTVMDSSASACCNLEASELFDQSGLSANYVSGVTDFDAFVASAPTHLGSSVFPFVGYFAAAPAFISLDLGQSLTLTRLALWNDQDYQGLKDFSVQIADNAAFAGAVSLGSFSAYYGLNNVGTGYDTPSPVQVFDLNGASGRYVRINLLNAHQDNFINIGEVAFGAGEATETPEPASLALLGLGLTALGLRRRKA